MRHKIIALCCSIKCISICAGLVVVVSNSRISRGQDGKKPLLSPKLVHRNMLPLLSAGSVTTRDHISQDDVLHEHIVRHESYARKVHSDSTHADGLAQFPRQLFHQHAAELLHDKVRDEKSHTHQIATALAEIVRSQLAGDHDANAKTGVKSEVKLMLRDVKIYQRDSGQISMSADESRHLVANSNPDLLAHLGGEKLSPSSVRMAIQELDDRLSRVSEPNTNLGVEFEFSVGDGPTEQRDGEGPEFSLHFDAAKGDWYVASGTDLQPIDMNGVFEEAGRESQSIQRKSFALAENELHGALSRSLYAEWSMKPISSLLEQHYNRFAMIGDGPYYKADLSIGQLLRLNRTELYSQIKEIGFSTPMTEANSGFKEEEIKQLAARKEISVDKFTIGHWLDTKFSETTHETMNGIGRSRLQTGTIETVKKLLNKKKLAGGNTEASMFHTRIIDFDAVIQLPAKLRSQNIYERDDLPRELSGSKKLLGKDTTMSKLFRLSFDHAAGRIISIGSSPFPNIGVAKSLTFHRAIQGYFGELSSH